MWKVKLIAIVAVLILTIVVLLQNTEAVQARILFTTVQMSGALLMMLTFVLGLIVGILVATYFLRGKGGKAKSGAGPSR
jgi:uncharacterized integral membrane protein